MAVNDRLSIKIELGQRFTKAEARELASWFSSNEERRDTIDWLLMGGDDARAWSAKYAGVLTGKVPAKYDNINFTPPDEVQEAAQQGLDYRDEYGRGGTSTGIARARDLSNGRDMSPDTIGRMVSFFARHQQNRDPDKTESDGGPSNGWIAWLLWGGDAGQRWSNKVSEQMDAADSAEKDLRDGEDVPAGGVPDEPHGKAGHAAGDDHAPLRDRLSGNCGVCQKADDVGEWESGDELDKAVKQYGPDAEWMPITFRGWDAKALDPVDPDAQSDPEQADASETVREGEPVTPIQQFARDLQAVFADQEQAVLQALGQVKGKAKPKRKARAQDIEAAAQALRDLDEALSNTVDRSITRILGAGARAAMERLRADFPDIEVDFDVFNPEVRAAIEQYSLELAGDVSRVSVDRLQRSLGQGLEAGETIPQLTQRVQDTFGSFSRDRAEMIARTESARAYETGAEESWKASDVVQGKEWLLAPNACPYCRAIAKRYEGKNIELGAAFIPKGGSIRGTDGQMYRANYADVTGAPAHPRCRCALNPVLKEA